MTKKTPSLGHRLDIEGLRGIAVLLVVLFHLGVPRLSGGFIGVDIFFVISGFVVTRTIASQLESGSFRLRDFYANRFWRLSPSFLLAALATMGLSALILSPAALQRSAQSAASAAFMSANFFFWLTTTGYESEAAEEAPFLQMWSLAVEEQFYLIWPLLLLIGARARALLKHPLSVLLLVLAGLALALGLSEWLARTSPSAAYYLLPARLFELGLGAACVAGERWARRIVWRPSAWLDDLVLALGGLLSVGSAFWLTDQSTFPGLAAFVPCIGISLMMQAGSHFPGESTGGRGLLSRFLWGAQLRYLGRISYAWYLWHWPGIALLHYSAIPLTASVALMVFVGSLTLAALSTHFWEAPTRRKPTLAWRLAVYAVALALASFTTSILLRAPSLPVVDEEASVAYRDLPCLFAAESWEELDACGRVEAQGTRRVLIWGDSHANPYRELFRHESKSWGWTATTVSSPGCPPLIGVKRRDPSDNARFCQGQIAQRVELLLERFEFDALLVVTRVDLYETGWIRKGRLAKSTHFLSDEKREAKTKEISAEVFHDHLPSTLRELLDRHELPIIYALPTPVMPRDTRKDKKKSMKVTRANYETMRARIEQTQRRLPRQVIVVDPIDELCGTEFCPAWDKRRPLYKDTNHLSLYGMRRLSPLIQSALERAVSP